MATQVHIQKTRDTILGMLALLDRKVGRTELVKLVYLSDSRFFESTGRTITGITYMWDHYGPNAVGHATANEADQMVNEGSVRVEIRPSMYSGYAYDYWVENPSEVWRSVESSLDPGERQILMDTVRKFGQLSLDSLIDHSKKTRPFADAKQYQVLALRQDESMKGIAQTLDSSGEFLEEVELSFADADAGRWVRDEDLDAFTES
ncbi:MAG: SocA family protein [Chloroflexi bacterium]|nr:SocA family protein [Chloroflexota bacterium]